MLPPTVANAQLAVLTTSDARPSTPRSPTAADTSARGATPGDTVGAGESICTPDAVRGVALTSPNARKLVLSSENVFRWLSSLVVVARRSED